MLTNVDDSLSRLKTAIIMAVSPDNKIDGAVVYFGDMQYYGSGGTATKEPDSAGCGITCIFDLLKSNLI